MVVLPALLLFCLYGVLKQKECTEDEKERKSSCMSVFRQECGSFSMSVCVCVCTVTIEGMISALEELRVHNVF